MIAGSRWQIREKESKEDSSLKHRYSDLYQNYLGNFYQWVQDLNVEDRIKSRFN